MRMMMENTFLPTTTKICMWEILLVKHKRWLYWNRWQWIHVEEGKVFFCFISLTPTSASIFSVRYVTSIRITLVSYYLKSPYFFLKHTLQIFEINWKIDFSSSFVPSNSTIAHLINNDVLQFISFVNGSYVLWSKKINFDFH